MSNTKLVDVVEIYNESAKEFALRYGVTSHHIINIVSSVMMTRDNVGYPGGGFVDAVVSNNLYLALSRADFECYHNLKVIVASMDHYPTI